MTLVYLNNASTTAMMDVCLVAASRLNHVGCYFFVYVHDMSRAGGRPIMMELSLCVVLIMSHRGLMVLDLSWTCGKI